MKLISSPSPEINLFKDLSDALIVHNSVPTIVFLCGGSTVYVYKYFVEKFDSFLAYAKNGGVTDFKNLTLALTDDRWFTDLNNENINYNVIEKSGFYQKFQNLGANVIKMSRSNNKENDSDSYNNDIIQMMKNDYKILIGGMGVDGHTCGILPQRTEDQFNQMYAKASYSAAVTVENVHPDRITLTPFAIKQMNECFLYINGQAKKETLNKFIYEDEELWKMPVQVYKKMDNVNIYTDIL